MKVFLTILILTFGARVYSQKFYTDLYGFRLGQYRSAAAAELGKPFRSGKFDDGFEYEAFLLKPDTSLYIVFEYAAKKTDIVWSIQVSGNNSTTDIGFKNVKLGISKEQTKGLIGTPSSIENIGEYGNKWNYDQTNFSIEINKKGKLSSVKILDNSGDIFPSGPDIKKIPAFEKIRTVLMSGNNAAILRLFAGDAEIYYQGKTYFFQKSLATESVSDYSQVLSTVKKVSNDLLSVNTNDPAEYEENMRLALGEDIKHVIKIKKGHIIKEIVLKYFGGQYYIYEINANAG